MTFLIYGASGYTGELIAREAKRRGLSPVLAGRSADKLAPLAGELGLEQRAFGLDTAQEVAPRLAGVRVVLHCAGPFSATSRVMIDACLLARVHYLDITGEIDVLEHSLGEDDRARRAGIVICSGVGFDVIPTDCLALALKGALPDATELALGFYSNSRMSPGTAKSSIEGAALGGRVRRRGQIVSVPFGSDVRHIDFGDGRGARPATSVPWGDVATAYHTTGIPNITVYVAASLARIRGLRLLSSLRFLLRNNGIQSVLKRRAARIPGPSADERAKSRTYVWGEVVNAAGQKKTARIETENGYSVTVSGSLAIVEELLRREACGEHVPAGSITPARLVGTELVARLPGSSAITVE
jgi:short subunit dehydrogenase-like uncharacterized protein